jgi:hypothetical protein
LQRRMPLMHLGPNAIAGVVERQGFTRASLARPVRFSG